MTFEEWWKTNEMSCSDARFVAQHAWHASRIIELGQVVEWLQHRCDYAPPCGRCNYCQIANTLISRMTPA